MKKSFWRAALLTVAAASFAACSHGGGGSAPGSYMVSGVTANGCLNMELLLGKMAHFPDGTMGRKYTTDISVQGTDGSTTQFLTLLTRSTFVFEDKPVKDLMNVVSAKQNACTSVTLYNDQGNGTDYQITGFDPKSVTMQDQADNKTITIALLSPTSLQATYSYPAMDVCDNGNPANVSTTQILKWGDHYASDSQENVSVSMLKNLTLSTDNAPQGVFDAINSAPDSSVEVSVDDLKALRDSPVRTDVLGCWPPPPAPIPPPPLPSASPDASPSPAPAAAAHLR